MKPIYFIINPKARNGNCLKIWERVEFELKRSKISYQALFTEYSGHAQKLTDKIAKWSNQKKIIIAVGGDGTVHEVMNGIIKHKNIILGFIPGGSGNDFSRGFAIPNDPLAALKVLLRLSKREAVLIDAGKMILKDQSDYYFINNMGAGFDALISYKVNRSRIKVLLNKLSLGRLIYVFFLLKELFTYKTSTIDLSIDGEKHIFEKTWFVTVSNQPFYGGGMKISPGAVPNDGLFDITVVHQLSRWKLLVVFISVFWGKHIYFKEVKRFKGRAVAIESSLPLYIHGDGEHIGLTPVKIELQPEVLQVLTRLTNRKEIDLEERDLNDVY